MASQRPTNLVAAVDRAANAQRDVIEAARKAAAEVKATEAAQPAQPAPRKGKA